MTTASSSRAAALVCLVLTAFGVLYAAAVAATGWEPSFGYLVQALVHVGELAAVVALALSGAAGSGRAARIGLGLALLGQLLLVVAELVYPGHPGSGDLLFTVAPPLTAVGLILAGAAVLRVGRWRGWHRFPPLLVGLYVIVALVPAVVVSGGPPARVAVWAIAGWDVGWLLIGVAVLAEARNRSGVPRR